METKTIRAMIGSKNTEDRYLAACLLRGAAKLFTEKQQTSLLKKISIMDRVKNYADVCEELGIKLLTIEDFAFLPTSERKRAFGFHKVFNIALCLNEGWLADFHDSLQDKWFPVFENTGAGFGFYCASTWRAYLYCPVGLYLKSKVLTEFAAKTFLEDYKDYIEP